MSVMVHAATSNKNDLNSLMIYESSKYRELVDIVGIYIEVRKYSPANGGILVNKNDQYIILILEQLKNLFSQLLRLEDQEGLQQNFYCHTNVAVLAASYKLLGVDVSNPSLTFIIGYCHRNLLEAIRKNVDDAVLNGIRSLKTTLELVYA